ncbi:MAG: peptidoglycan DD-metalloendopeptidase family protein [Fimbriimonadaceae bacterium]|nr:peptidoglycan DD-metalloendopeptidase family protein [Alphaproteobacteria bacterium]
MDANNAPQPALDAAGTASESLAGGYSQITVGQTDTLYSLSRRYGISERNILAANSLNKPSDIQAGQRILMPPVSYRPGDAVPSMTSNGNSGNNSIASSQLPAPAAPRVATTYTVQPGDTLYGIARQNNVNAKELASANNLSSPNSIRVGQRLVMPGEGGATAPQRTTVGQTQQAMSNAMPANRPANINPSNQRVASIGANDAQTVPMPTARPAYQSNQTVAPTSQTQTSSAPATTPTQVASARPTGNSGPLPAPEAMSSSQFRWPVRGRVISGFGSKSNGAKNDGINIAVPAGTSIKAAENGVVAYAGNELEGYGNLILIRHENDWVTAYAHSSRVLVQRGDKVRRGQIIAQAGQTGSVDRPQLHFELRQGSRPIDPEPHMSGS